MSDEKNRDDNVYGVRRAPEKVARLGLVRAKDHLYLLDAELCVLRVPRDPKTGALGEPELVSKVEHVRERGFFYFLDAEGDLARRPEPPR